LADAASIVPATTSAISENATRRAITIPAAWPISTWSPARVDTRSPTTPRLADRACASVTSTSPGSTSQITAELTVPRGMPVTAAASR
jgi:hypothetical protein